jgi:hypothetical protein
LCLQAAYQYLPYAPHWVELYRRQRRFPKRAYWLLVILARSFFNAIMMLGKQQGGIIYRVASVASGRSQGLSRSCPGVYAM